MVGFEFIGLIGSLLLSIAGIPEVVRTIKDNRCHLGLTFLSIWFGGEIFMLIYVIPLRDVPLLLNYVFNFFVVTIMFGYKVVGRIRNKRRKKIKGYEFQNKKIN